MFVKKRCDVTSFNEIAFASSRKKLEKVAVHISIFWYICVSILPWDSRWDSRRNPTGNGNPIPMHIPIAGAWIG